MALAIVSAVWDKLIEAGVGLAAGKIGLPRGVDNEQIRKLSSKFEQLRGVLDDAERKQFWDKRITPWLDKLEDISYEMDAILDEWNTMNLKREIENEAISSEASTSKKRKVLSLISAPLIFMDEWGVRVNIGTKIEKLNERLDVVLNEMRQFNFIKSMLANNSRQWKRDPSCSFVDVSEIFGREIDMDVLRAKLVQENTGGPDSHQIISIIGSGGIGKTTLAQLLYNDDQVKNHFKDERAWVCVSDPFDNVKVARAIVQCLEGDWPNLDELDPLLQKIMKLTHGKRLILVMDDVWTEDYAKWAPIVESLRYANPGSRLLLTTRSERVARVSGATYICNLGVLSESDSWSLFCKIAFYGRWVAHTEVLESIGHMILEKCKGLPLAIKTLSSLLRWKDSVQEWQDVANSNVWELEVAELELFPHLYLSYDDLTPAMKRCFTFCTIFPKDTKIQVDDLVRLWMAEGSLGSTGDMEKTGEECFINMCMRSLFQNFQMDSHGERIESCTLHDIVHDFLQYLTKGKCSVIEDAEKLEAGKVIGSDKLRHLTLSTILHSESGENIPTRTSLCIIGNPRGLFINGPILRELSIDLLNRLKYVRELRLFCCLDIPKELGNLIHLRYLELSPSRGLPATIYNLCNLQTLKLDLPDDDDEEEVDDDDEEEDDDDDDELFPSGIEKLKNLRNLICDEKVGVAYPDGLKYLTALKSLTWFTAGTHHNQWVQLEALNQLRGSLSITIKVTSYVKEIKMAKLELKTCLQGLQIWLPTTHLTLEGINAIEAFEPPPNLRQLHIYSYFGRTRIPQWITSLIYLRELILFNWENLSSISSLERMPTLESFNFPGHG